MKTFQYNLTKPAAPLVNAFLAKDIIIKDIVCDSHTHYIKLKNSNYTIKKYKNSHKLVADIQFKKLNVQRQHDETYS